MSDDETPGATDDITAELPDGLLDAARRVRANAHVPYSRYAVGAAILTPGGRVFVGCNVENAAYPEGTCAEAGAIAAMVAAGEREISVIVVVTDGPTAGTPCGGCRQKIREFAGATTRVHTAVATATTTEIRASYGVADLLPDSFGPECLPNG